MRTLLRWVWGAVEYAALVAFVCMLVLVTAQVFLRYVLEVSVPWTEEAARWFYAYQIFLGLIVACRDNLNLQATFLLDRFPPRIKGGLECLMALGGLIFMGGILYGGVVMVWATSAVEAGSFTLSMSYLYLVIPVSLTFIVVLSLGDLARGWRALRRSPEA